MKKRKIVIIPLALFLLYLTWLGWLLLHFKKYKFPSSSLALSQTTQIIEGKDRKAISPSWFEIEGVYHIHTLYSDGWEDARTIAKIAARSSLDFIILVDHGNPNFQTLASQGWINGVLVLAGSELSVNRGHLVGLGFAQPKPEFSQNAELAVHEINALGGFSIIAHPYSKTRWSWGEFVEYAGIELMDADSAFKKNFLASLPYCPGLLVKPSFTLIKMLDEPQQTFRKWDELTRLRPIYAYLSADAHLLYRPVFSLFHLHLLLPEALSKEFESARRQVFVALRQGNFYNAVEAAAEARGFRFWAEKAGKTFPMGSVLSFDLTSPPKLFIQTRFPFAKETRLMHNGKMMHSTDQDATQHQIHEPGVYRVEVYLKEKTPLNKNIPWIVSNPIFLRKEKE